MMQIMPLCPANIDTQFLKDVAAAMKEGSTADGIFRAFEARQTKLQELADMKPKIPIAERERQFTKAPGYPFMCQWDFDDFIGETRAEIRAENPKLSPADRLHLVVQHVNTALQVKPDEQRVVAFSDFLMEMEKREPDLTIREAISRCREHMMVALAIPSIPSIPAGLQL